MFVKIGRNFLSSTFLGKEGLALASGKRRWHYFILLNPWKQDSARAASLAQTV